MAIIGIVGMDMDTEIYSHKQKVNLVSENYTKLFEKKVAHL